MEIRKQQRGYRSTMYESLGESHKGRVQVKVYSMHSESTLRARVPFYDDAVPVRAY